MALDITNPASRLRAFVTRLLVRLGFRDDSFILILAVVVGFVTAVAAVGFHSLINLIREVLYLHAGEARLYSHTGLILLVLFPALGGLAVGLISRYVFHTREGHGIVDVVESVVRTSGFQKPVAALEKILTSGITIGSGGSAGAEGPIVQIGAGIASGVGQLFRVARQHMPVLIGCGSAAGISAIFNAPFGGVLFTLEVILQDFSIRAITPVVVASVIAQVTELLLFQFFFHEPFHPIFHIMQTEATARDILQWGQVGNFVLLGIICGLAGLALNRAMYFTERSFGRLNIPPAAKPAIGGGVMGLMGIAYVVIFGRLMLHTPKPVDFKTYPMPAFFGDGYGFIEQLLSPTYTAYGTFHVHLLMLLASLCLIKIIATCLTLGSGGSGGVIAPSLFIGATAGAVLGVMLRQTGAFPNVHPEVYALVGMGAVLAAVVHAPLASILIVFEVTHDDNVMVPAMLACIISTGVARVIYRDSIYTASLRLRGIRTGAGTDLTLLRRMNVEQVALEPASSVHPNDPFQKVLDLTTTTGVSNFVVVNEKGEYQAMVVDEDITTALVDREAIPLLVVQELARFDLPLIKNTDDLGVVLDAFSRYDVSHLPVTMSSRPNHVIGLISRTGLMRKYSEGLSEPL